MLPSRGKPLGPGNVRPRLYIRERRKYRIRMNAVSATRVWLVGSRDENEVNVTIPLSLRERSSAKDGS